MYNIILRKKTIESIWRLFNNRSLKQLQLDLEKFNLSHVDFVFINEKEVHAGARLKVLGRKWFAVLKMDIDVFSIMEKLK